MMKICLVNVSDVDEAMRSRLRVWRNSEKVSPFFLLDQVTEEQHRAWLERNVRGEDARACVIYAKIVIYFLSKLLMGIHYACVSGLIYNNILASSEKRHIFHATHEHN